MVCQKQNHAVDIKQVFSLYIFHSCIHILTIAFGFTIIVDYKLRVLILSIILPLRHVMWFMLKLLVETVQNER